MSNYPVKIVYPIGHPKSNQYVFNASGLLQEQLLVQFQQSE